jgi:very-short-patch-repair endonuclease
MTFKNSLLLKIRRQSLREEQTEAERLLWQKLRAKRFFNYKFYRQYSVGNYILDFYCPAIYLAIEVDGSQHVDQADYDKERTNYLRENNVTVLRYWNNDVMKNINAVLEDIMAHLPNG